MHDEVGVIMEVKARDVRVGQFIQVPRGDAYVEVADATIEEQGITLGCGFGEARFDLDEYVAVHDPGGGDRDLFDWEVGVLLEPSAHPAITPYPRRWDVDTPRGTVTFTAETIDVAMRICAAMAGAGHPRPHDEDIPF